MTIGSFFGGGSKGISFDVAPPKTVSGTITAVHPPEPVIDMATNKPAISRRSGRPRMQVRIDLQTDERNPEIEFDDGSRTLYVKSWMTGAIGDALRKAGSKEPEIGGKLSITFTHEEPSTPGLNPIKKFTATYEPPSSATENYFASGGQSVPAQEVSTVKPASIGDAAWAAMDATARAAVVSALATPSNGPVKPAAISDAAWSSMDESTRRAVATTMATMASVDSGPPF